MELSDWFKGFHKVLPDSHLNNGLLSFQYLAR